MIEGALHRRPRSIPLIIGVKLKELQDNVGPHFSFNTLTARHCVYPAQDCVLSHNFLNKILYFVSPRVRA